jgi:hypothetical protein
MIVPIAFLVTALPLSIGGWGARESGFVVGFGWVGLAATDALALSILFGVLNMAVRLPGGLIWLFWTPRLMGSADDRPAPGL